MNKLELARLKINEIDQQMATLFEKRMEAVKDVVEYKIENNLPIYDASRENEVIEKNIQYLENEDLKIYYREYIMMLMNISKKYQNDIKEK